MASPLLYPALAEVALITYRDVKNGSNVDNPIPHFPLPSQYVSVAIVYGGLSLFPQQADRLASLIGWGFVVATALNVFTPGKTVLTSSGGAAPTILPVNTGTTTPNKTGSGNPIINGIKNTLKITTLGIL